MKIGLILLKAYRLLPICLFVCLTAKTAKGGQPDNSYRDSLISSSKIYELSKERAWRTLLHYPGFSGGTSKIDDPSFFLSSNGKNDPEAELSKTIKGLFEPVDLGDKHPICRFPARLKWLLDISYIDVNLLPAPRCTEQNEYLIKTNPKSASIMFPSAYLNSPASMFGHTYIRLDSNFKSELLSYAINYAAHTDENNGLVYAWKGVFGQYKGYYSILPQYAKIREYSNLEHRDIWEYRLNLTVSEVQRMALHIWELREVSSDYFFFDENCSYNLLFLIEVARPTVQLTNKTYPWVIPLDTINLIKTSDLISSIEYRPSQRQKIQAITDLMNKEEIILGEKIANQYGLASETTDSLPPDRRILILDLATELLQYSYGKSRIDQDTYRSRLLTLLRERNLLTAAVNNQYKIARPISPDQGHPSLRLNLRYGMDRGRFFTELGFRPAYHSLGDPYQGYINGAQIQFLNISIRHYLKQNETRLEQLDILDIISLSAYEQIFKRTSWKITTGLTQAQKNNGKDALVFRINSGGGLTFENSLLGLTYGMLELEVNAGEGLRNGFAAGAGLSLGFVKQVNDHVQVNVNGSYISYQLGEKRRTLRSNAAFSYSLNARNSVKIECIRAETARHTKLETSMSWNYYF